MRTLQDILGAIDGLRESLKEAPSMDEPLMVHEGLELCAILRELGEHLVQIERRDPPWVNPA